MTDAWEEFKKIYGDSSETSSVMAACVMDLEARVKWLEQLVLLHKEASHE
jgi:hypothetical protein